MRGIYPHTVQDLPRIGIYSMAAAQQSSLCTLRVLGVLQEMFAVPQ